MSPESRSGRLGRGTEVLILVIVLGALGVGAFVTRRPDSAATTPDSLAAQQSNRATNTPAVSVAPIVQAPTSAAYPPPRSLASPPPTAASINMADVAAYPAPGPSPSALSGDPRSLRPTPDPSLPYQVVVHIDRVPSTTISTEDAEVIVIGTVKHVSSARWTTPDGQRPANPSTARQDIFRPVLIEAEEYLKGQRPERQLHIFAWGGVVGQDSARREPDAMDEYREGERVVVFLKAHNSSNHEAALQGQQFWNTMEHYTITADGQAANYYGTIPLQQLRSEIARALRK